MNTTAVKLPLVVLAALILQTSLFAELRVFDVSADLMLLLPVAAALTGGPERGAVVGFVSGICYDLLLSTPFGMSALAFTLIGYGTGLVERQVLRAAWWIPLVTAALASAAGVVVYVLVGAGVGQTDFFHARLGAIIAVVGVFNGLLSIAVVPVMRWTCAGPRVTERAYLR
jgi:rod shape-determining protein MreD